MSAFLLKTCYSSIPRSYFVIPTAALDVAMVIRPALPHDIEAITAIYNDAVLTTTAIWNDKPVTVQNRLGWLHAHQEANLPVLVAVDQDQTIMGYATFGPWRDFEGFRHTVEHSVYVEKTKRGHGIGRKLLEALIDQARSNHKHVMVAAIESRNTASIQLHKKLGFIQTGHMPEVGEKFGRWLDLTFLQLTL